MYAAIGSTSRIMGVLSLFLLCLCTLFLSTDAWIVRGFPVAKSYKTRSIRLEVQSQTENEPEVRPDAISHHNAQQSEEQEDHHQDYHISDADPSNRSCITGNATEIDPTKEAIAKLEKELKAELDTLERKLSLKRISLNQARNRLMESGPRGYYLIQAQVNEFLRNKAADEQKLVDLNKKEFVLKLLPLIDSFRLVPQDYPAETEEEKKIHQNYKVILLGLELAVKKFGYSEILPQTGEKLNSHFHQVVGVEETEAAGLIVRCEKSGWNHTVTNEVIRKANVVATAVKPPPPPPSPPQELPQRLDSKSDHQVQISPDEKQEDNVEQKTVQG